MCGIAGGLRGAGKGVARGEGGRGMIQGDGDHTCGEGVKRLGFRTYFTGRGAGVFKAATCFPKCCTAAQRASRPLPVWDCRQKLGGHSGVQGCRGAGLGGPSCGPENQAIALSATVFAASALRTGRRENAR